MEIKDFLKKQFKTEVFENQTKQKVWLTWYKNTNPWRNYYVTLSNQKRSKKKMTRLSLNSCKRMCEDTSNLLLNEKTDVVVGDKEQNDIVQNVFEYTDFWQLANKSVEKNQAIGGGAFVINKNEQDKIDIQYVDGTRCYVLNANNNEVIDCAFENKIIIDGENYTTLSVHVRNDDEFTYTIYNYLFDEDSNLLTDEQMMQLTGVNATVQSVCKTFSFFAPQNVSKDNWDTPFSDSVFAKAVDANKLVDLSFDSYANEFILGKKRIFVASELATYEKVEIVSSKNGEKTTETIRVPVFDENETVFNLLPESNDGKTLIKEIDMTLRVEQHEKAIQDALNYFASLCGMGEKFYKYENGNITTATQVISENSTLFRNIQKQQVPLERMLKEVCEAILGLYGITEIAEITVEFDDSIIIDREAERQRDLIDVRDGIMSKAEYRSKYYGEDLEQAQAKIDEISRQKKAEEEDLNPWRIV